ATGVKRPVGLSDAAGLVAEALDAEQALLLAEAQELRDGRTEAVESLEDAAEAARDGAALLPWSLVGDAGEDFLAQTGVGGPCRRGARGGLPGARGAKAAGARVAAPYWGRGGGHRKGPGRGPSRC